MQGFKDFSALKTLDPVSGCRSINQNVILEKSSILERLHDFVLANITL